MRKISSRHSQKPALYFYLQTGGTLDHSEIRSLRQRLGWTLAEMARRMGCTPGLIRSWEAGEMKPDPDAINQLHYLQFHVEKKSAQVSQCPLAEKEMESRGVAQLTHRDLLKDIQ